MKCEFCDGNLSLEDEFCPHCGRPNKHAQKHVADMRNYEGRFQHAEAEVYATTRHYSETSMRMIIIAVMVVLLAVLCVVKMNVYEIYDSVMDSRNLAEKSKHFENMEAYLEDGDYIGFSEYCEKQQIYSSDEGFEEYCYLIEGSRDYRTIRTQVMYSLAQDSESSVSVEDTAKTIGREWKHLYSRKGRETYNGEYGKAQYKLDGHMEEMLEDINSWLIVYCNVPAEDVARFAEMSEAEMVVLLEECMNNEK